MKNRSVIYFSKAKALRIISSPMEADLKTLLSATFAVSHNRIVKKHIQQTLHRLEVPTYRLSA